MNLLLRNNLATWAAACLALACAEASPSTVAAGGAGATNLETTGGAGAGGAMSVATAGAAGSAGAASGGMGGMVAAAGTGLEMGGAGGNAGEAGLTDAFESVDLRGNCRGGTPQQDGETIVLERYGSYDVTAYGSEMGHHCGEDQGRFVYMQLEGDFDVQVRLAHMDNFGALHGDHSTPVKSGLMVRRSLDPDDLYIAIHAASPDELYPDAFHYDMRRQVGGWLGIEGTFSYGYLNRGHAIYARQFPNIWVRLKREGNTFSAYASQDGENWVSPSGNASYTADWGTTLYVGMSASSAPEGQFDDMSVTEFRDLSGFPELP